MAKLFKSEAEGQYYYGDTPDNALPAKVFTSPSDPDAIYYQTDQMADPVLYVPAMSGGAQAGSWIAPPILWQPSRNWCRRECAPWVCRPPKKAPITEH